MSDTLELYAWIGEDEYGSGKVGLKQAIVPAGIIAMVSIERNKLEKYWEQAEAQAKRYGKRIKLARFSLVEIVRETEYGAWSKEDDFLRHARDDMIPKMRESVMSMTIYSGEIDAKLCVELGAAILLDKPLIVLLQKGVKAPANLKRCASRIVEIDRNVMDERTQREIQQAIDSVLAHDRRAHKTGEI